MYRGGRLVLADCQATNSAVTVVTDSTPGHVKRSLENHQPPAAGDGCGQVLFSWYAVPCERTGKGGGAAWRFRGAVKRPESPDGLWADKRSTLLPFAGNTNQTFRQTFAPALKSEKADLGGETSLFRRKERRDIYT